MDKTDKMQRTINGVIIAVIAFILGFGAAWLWITKSPAGVKDSINGSENAMINGDDSLNKQVFGDTVAVTDQMAGLTVMVDLVSLNSPAWVAIHEDNNGEPGNILGAQLFSAGSHEGSVELLRGMLSGQTYYAMIHIENGDHAFDPKIDVPLIGETGQPIWTSFRTIAE